MQRVKNKVAIVTGAGSGIGKATAEVLAKEGAAVVVTDINLKAAESTALGITEQGGSALALLLDVSSETGWETVFSETLETFNSLDLLVNNAGMFSMNECCELTLDQWRAVMSVNLDGVFLGVSGAIRIMRQNPRECSIINIASVNSLPYGAFENCSAYCASKAGVSLLTRCAALECGRNGYGIRLNSICPGGVNTAMNDGIDEETLRAKRSGHPIGRMAEPVDIAKAVLFLASDEAGFITGSDFIVDGGATAGFVSGVYPEPSLLGNGLGREHLDESA